MTNESFKQAFLQNDPAAELVGDKVYLAFAALVEGGLILEYSSTWWNMCEVAWEAHQKATTQQGELS